MGFTPQDDDLLNEYGITPQTGTAPKKRRRRSPARNPEDAEFRGFFEDLGWKVNRTYGRAINPGSPHPAGLGADINIDGKTDEDVGDLVEKAIAKGYRLFDERVKQPGVKRTGPHLHFERPPSGTKPSKFLPGRYGSRDHNYLRDLDNRRRKGDDVEAASLLRQYGVKPATSGQGTQEPEDDLLKQYGIRPGRGPQEDMVTQGFGAPESPDASLMDQKGGMATPPVSPNVFQPTTPLFQPTSDEQEDEEYANKLIGDPDLQNRFAGMVQEYQAQGDTPRLAELKARRMSGLMNMQRASREINNEILATKKFETEMSGVTEEFARQAMQNPDVTKNLDVQGTQNVLQAYQDMQRQEVLAKHGGYAPYYKEKIKAAVPVQAPAQAPSAAQPPPAEQPKFLQYVDPKDPAYPAYQKFIQDAAGQFQEGTRESIDAFNEAQKALATVDRENQVVNQQPQQPQEQSPTTAQRLPSRFKSGQKEATPEDILKGHVRYRIDLSHIPAEQRPAYALEQGRNALANDYGISGVEAEGIVGKFINQVGAGDSYIIANIPRADIASIIGQDRVLQDYEAEVAPVRAEAEAAAFADYEKRRDADELASRSRVPGGRAGSSLNEPDAERALEDRIDDADYSMTQRIGEMLGNPAEWGNFVYTPYGPGIGASAKFISPEWAAQEKKRLKDQHGSYSAAWDAEKYYQNAGVFEVGSRFVNQFARSFAKNAVGGTAKSALFLADKLGDVGNPLNMALEALSHNELLKQQGIDASDFKIGIRNAGNILDFLTRITFSPNAKQAWDETQENWVGEDAGLSKQQLFKAAEQFDEAIGDDPVLKGRFFGALADAGGSAASFIALGALMPEMQLAKFMPRGMSRFVGKAIRNTDAASGISGAIQAVGPGYSEGKQAGLTENEATAYGVIQGILGLSEMVGAGQGLTHAIKSPKARMNLALGIMDAMKKGGKAVLQEGKKEAKEEFFQEVFQSTGGKAALEYLKDHEPGQFRRVVDALKRLPKQLGETIPNEGLIGALTGGLMGGGGAALSSVRGGVQDVKFAKARGQYEQALADARQAQHEDSRREIDEITAPIPEAKPSTLRRMTPDDTVQKNAIVHLKTGEAVTVKEDLGKSVKVEMPDGSEQRFRKNNLQINDVELAQPSPEVEATPDVSPETQQVQPAEAPSTVTSQAVQVGDSVVIDGQQGVITSANKDAIKVREGTTYTEYTPQQFDALNATQGVEQRTETKAVETERRQPILDEAGAEQLKQPQQTRIYDSELGEITPGIDLTQKQEFTGAQAPAIEHSQVDWEKSGMQNPEQITSVQLVKSNGLNKQGVPTGRVKITKNGQTAAIDVTFKSQEGQGVAEQVQPKEKTATIEKTGVRQGTIKVRRKDGTGVVEHRVTAPSTSNEEQFNKGVEDLANTKEFQSLPEEEQGRMMRNISFPDYTSREQYYAEREWMDKELDRQGLQAIGNAQREMLHSTIQARAKYEGSSYRTAAQHVLKRVTNPRSVEDRKLKADHVKGRPLNVNEHKKLQEILHAVKAQLRDTGMELDPHGNVQNLGQLVMEAFTNARAGNYLTSTPADIARQALDRHALRKAKRKIKVGEHLKTIADAARNLVKKQQKMEAEPVPLERQLAAPVTFQPPYTITALVNKRFDEFRASKNKLISKGQIENIAKAGDTKPIEKELINSILNSPLFEGRKNIPFSEFEAEVSYSLMPLRVIYTTSHGAYGNDYIGLSNLDQAMSHIYVAQMYHGYYAHWDELNRTSSNLPKFEVHEELYLNPLSRTPTKEELAQGTGAEYVPKSIYYIVPTKEARQNAKAVQIQDAGGAELSRENLDRWAIQSFQTQEEADKFVEEINSRTHESRGVFGHLRRWVRGDDVFAVEAQGEGLQMFRYPSNFSNTRVKSPIRQYEYSTHGINTPHSMHSAIEMVATHYTELFKMRPPQNAEEQKIHDLLEQIDKAQTEATQWFADVFYGQEDLKQSQAERFKAERAVINYLTRPSYDLPGPYEDKDKGISKISERKRKRAEALKDYNPKIAFQTALRNGVTAALSSKLNAAQEASKKYREGLKLKGSWRAAVHDAVLAAKQDFEENAGWRNRVADLLGEIRKATGEIGRDLEHTPHNENQQILINLLDDNGYMLNTQRTNQRNLGELEAYILRNYDNYTYNGFEQKAEAWLHRMQRDNPQYLKKADSTDNLPTAGELQMPTGSELSDKQQIVHDLLVRRDYQLAEDSEYFDLSDVVSDINESIGEEDNPNFADAAETWFDQMLQYNPEYFRQGNDWEYLNGAQFDYQIRLKRYQEAVAARAADTASQAETEKIKEDKLYNALLARGLQLTPHEEDAIEDLIDSIDQYPGDFDAQLHAWIRDTTENFPEMFEPSHPDQRPREIPASAIKPNVPKFFKNTRTKAQLYANQLNDKESTAGSEERWFVLETGDPLSKVNNSKIYMVLPESTHGKLKNNEETLQPNLFETQDIEIDQFMPEELRENKDMARAFENAFKNQFFNDGSIYDSIKNQDDPAAFTPEMRKGMEDQLNGRFDYMLDDLKRNSVSARERYAKVKKAASAEHIAKGLGKYSEVSKLWNQIEKSVPMQIKQFLYHRKNFGQRMIREEIRRAAKEGKKFFHIPTGATGSIVEMHIDRHTVRMGSVSKNLPYQVRGLRNSDTFAQTGILRAGDSIIEKDPGTFLKRSEFNNLPQLVVLNATESEITAGDASAVKRLSPSRVIENLSSETVPTDRRERDTLAKTILEEKGYTIISTIEGTDYSNADALNGVKVIDEFSILEPGANIRVFPQPDPKAQPDPDPEFFQQQYEADRGRLTIYQRFLELEKWFKGEFPHAKLIKDENQNSWLQIPLTKEHAEKPSVLLNMDPDLYRRRQDERYEIASLEHVDEDYFAGISHTVDDDGAIKVSLHAADYLRRLEAERHPDTLDGSLWNAFFTPARDLQQKIADINRDIVAYLDAGWGAHEIQGLIDLAKELSALPLSQGRIVYVYENAKRHEQLHQLRFLQAVINSSIANYYDDFEATYDLQEDTIKKAYKKFFKRVYFQHKDYNDLSDFERTVLYEETFVFIADGKAEVPLGLTLDEAATFIENDLHAYTAENGMGMLDHLGEYLDESIAKFAVVEQVVSELNTQAQLKQAGQSVSGQPAVGKTPGNSGSLTSLGEEQDQEKIRRSGAETIAERTVLEEDELTPFGREYTRISRSETAENAEAWVSQQGFDAAFAQVIGELPPSAQNTARRMAVIEHIDAEVERYHNAGDDGRAREWHSRLVALTNSIAPDYTEYGQAISQLARWSDLDPAAIVAVVTQRRQRSGKGALNLQAQKQLREDAKTIAKLNKRIADLEAKLKGNPVSATTRALSVHREAKNSALDKLKDAFGTLRDANSALMSFADDLDLVPRGRGGPKGELSPQSKITEDQIQEAHKKYQAGESLRTLATEYGVSAPLLHRKFIQRGLEIRNKSEAASVGHREGRLTKKSSGSGAMKSFADEADYSFEKDIPKEFRDAFDDATEWLADQQKMFLVDVLDGRAEEEDYESIRADHVQEGQRYLEEHYSKKVAQSLTPWLDRVSTELEKEFHRDLNEYRFSSKEDRIEKLKGDKENEWPDMLMNMEDPAGKSLSDFEPEIRNALIDVGLYKLLEGRMGNGQSFEDWSASVANELGDAGINPSQINGYYKALYRASHTKNKQNKFQAELERVKAKYDIDNDGEARQKLIAEKQERAAKQKISNDALKQARPNTTDKRTAQDIAIDNHVENSGTDLTRPDVLLAKDRNKFFSHYTDEGLSPKEINDLYLEAVDIYIDASQDLQDAKAKRKAEAAVKETGITPALTREETKQINQDLQEAQKEKYRASNDLRKRIKHLTDQPETNKQIGMDWYKRINRSGEAMLTATLKTAMHNLYAQRITKGLNAIETGIELGLAKIERRTGKKIFAEDEFGIHPDVSFLDLIAEEAKSSSFPAVRKAAMDLMRGDANLMGALQTIIAHKQMVAEGLLAYNPDLYDKMIGQFSFGEGAKEARDMNPTLGPVGKGFEYMVRKLESAVAVGTSLNGLQEKHFRFATFLGTLSADLKAQGFSIEEAQDEGRVKEIPRQALERAVMRALDDTFGHDIPRGGPGLDALNAAHHAASYIPFMMNPLLFRRFFVSSNKYMIEHSPLVLAKIATEKGFTKRDAAKFMMGVGMFTFALGLLRAFGSDDDDPTLLKIGGRHIRISAYNPISTMLVLANFFDRKYRKGKTMFKTPADIFQVTGIDSRYPNPALDWFKTIVKLGGKDPDRFDKAGEQSRALLGKGLAAYLRPFTTVKDIIAQFDEQEGYVRDYGDDKFVGELAKNFPGIGRSYAARENALTGEPLKKESPLLDQLGISFVSDNQVGAKFTPAEEYLDVAAQESRDNRPKKFKTAEERAATGITAQLYTAIDKGNDIAAVARSYKARGVINKNQLDSLLDANKMKSTVERKGKDADIRTLSEAMVLASPEEREILKKVLREKVKNQKKSKSLSAAEQRAAEEWLTPTAQTVP